MKVEHLHTGYVSGPTFQTATKRRKAIIARTQWYHETVHKPETDELTRHESPTVEIEAKRYIRKASDPVRLSEEHRAFVV